MRPPDLPIAFESDPGVASSPLPSGYRRRQPENTLLYEVVLQHLPEFLREMRGQDEHGYGVPRFVEQEFRRYLACGILAHGFARLHCDGCGHEILCAFSCKRRGICPSCSTRRMQDTAAHIVDRVLPRIPIRQWVISFPRVVRFDLARDTALFGKVLSTFLQVVFAWQRRRARREGVSTPLCGAIAFEQRFGGALNLNVHVHAALPDGVFSVEDGEASFHPLSPPTDEEVLAITLKVKKRVEGLLPQHREEDVPADALATMQAQAVRAKFPTRGDDDFDPHPRRRCAFVQGYSLHADVYIHENDRAGLERLLRYGARPALALARLDRMADGRIRYALKRPTKAGGPLELVLTPIDLLRRLAALVPPPKSHLVRYFGVFAPNSKVRSLIVPEVPADGVAGRSVRCEQQVTHEPRGPAEGKRGSDGVDGVAGEPGGGQGDRQGGHNVLVVVPGSGRMPATFLTRRLPWAELLARVYSVDVLACARCGGRIRVLAFFTEGDVTRRILDHLGLPSSPPAPVSSARDPTAEPAVWRDDYFIDVDPGYDV